MIEAETPAAVVRILQTSYQPALAGIIAIDGIDGAGKTPLAFALQSLVGGTVVSLDDFVLKNRGGYVAHLESDRVRRLLAESPRPILVEGVCVLAALAKVGARLDVLVYVKRVAEYGIWYDDTICDPEEPLDQLLARLSEHAALFAQHDPDRPAEEPAEAASLSPFREEIIRYHAVHRPSRLAQIVYLSAAP